MRNFARIIPSLAGGIYRYLVVFGVLTLAACATVEPPASLVPIGATEILTLPTEVPEFAGAPLSIIDTDNIYSLPTHEADNFFKYYNDPKNRNVSESKRIANYLMESTSAYKYLPDTRTAGEVMLEAGGNCLSLANLTTAIARLAGVNVSYQLITDFPVYERENDIILRSVHVRSKISDPLTDISISEKGAGTTIRRDRKAIIIDYFPSGNGRFIRNISEAEFTAMHYRNLAGEAIVLGEYSTAYWYVRASLDLASDEGESLNMLAILYRRNGDDENAERIYRYGIEYADNRLSLLKNYRWLLREQGRNEEADRITEELRRMDHADPFEWLFLAEDAYDEGSYSDALSYYKRAVDVASYLHEGYLGMAKSYYQMGETDNARKTMRQAVDKASQPRLRALYKAKLEALSGPDFLHDVPVENETVGPAALIVETEGR